MRADDGLTIRDNVIAGRWLPPGTDVWAAADCAAISDLNQLSAKPCLFRDPERGDLRPR